MTRILVVDDEEQFARLASIHLSSQHAIDLAKGAEEALVRLDQTVYDAVLTDLHMPPGVDGIGASACAIKICKSACCRQSTWTK